MRNVPMNDARGYRVLIAGESWIMHTIHQKGVDSFTTTTYGTGHDWLSDALTRQGNQVTHLPNHLAASEFPTRLDQLQAYDVVILSDIGSNTLLLHPDTFERSQAMPNRLTLIHDYVAAGGGLIMVGGYFTFQGFEAKARYGGTPIETALPVTILPGDDRVEVPEGRAPRLVGESHEIVAGLPDSWPALLGYNRVVAKEDAPTLVSVGDDPLLVAWQFGAGRALAFTSDCGPHWLPPDFLAWDGYPRLWNQMVTWVGNAAGN